MNHKSVLLIGLLLTIFACSTVPKPRQLQEQLLSVHISSWKNLRIDGVAEINYKGFALRKNIVIRKNEEALRADLFDSGIFGMSPAPFAGVYFGDELWVTLPGKKSPEQFTTDNTEKLSTISEMIFNTEKLYERKDDIISGYKTEFENTVITFNENFQIEKIELADKNYYALFTYEEHLSEITFWSNNQKAAEIIVDKINFEKQEVNKFK